MWVDTYPYVRLHQPHPMFTAGNIKWTLGRDRSYLATQGEVLDHFCSILRPDGVAYISTPNVLTLAPPGQPKSDNPWHVREYRAEEFDALCRSVFEHVELVGVFHARKLRLHELALRAGWDALHQRLGITKAFYDRFTPAISTNDFALRHRPLRTALDFLAVCRS